MKTALLTAATVLALTSGCATTPRANDVAANDSNIDYAKMNAISNIAHARGVLVRWINLPVKASPPAVGVVPARPEPAGT